VNASQLPRLAEMRPDDRAGASSVWETMLYRKANVLPSEPIAQVHILIRRSLLF
jgi:hypothetical protein